MRPTLTLAAVAAFALSSPALAQGPLNQGAAGGPATVGGVPTLTPESGSTVPQAGGEEPQRAPGSAADQGVNMPLSSGDSGTTTTYEPAAKEEPVQWPCAQPKVPSISAGTLWSGPNLAEGKGWEDDRGVAELAQKLASRRLPVDEAQPLIASFAKAAGPDKDKKLTELFVGMLDIINGNRDEILQGIVRYARGQERLAERMRTESDKISEADSDVHGPTGIAATEAHRDFAWDQRIFKERKQALSFVCETPSILERRAYDISKRIQEQL